MTTDDEKLSSNSNIQFGKNMKICNQLYTLAHKIGSGNFGQVYLGVCNVSKPIKGAKLVAIKVQKEVPGKPPQLPCQFTTLKCLKSDKYSIGFPEIYQHGFQKNNHYLVMELLGPNLSDLMKLCGGKFSLGTTVFLAMQIFQRIQFLHSKGYVYRDIKPENFMMGIAKRSSVLYMIDFGMAKTFRDPRINLHKPYRQQRDFSGTLRYASICSHLRIQHSRRDDLESTCYMLIYFLLGSLPWQSKKTENIDMKQRIILDKKLKISPSQLCEGIPLEFRNILEYCQQLDYYEDPDYEYIQSQLIDLSDKIALKNNIVYDWALLKQQQTIAKDDLKVKIKPYTPYMFSQDSENEYDMMLNGGNHNKNMESKQKKQIRWKNNQSSNDLKI